MKDNWKISILVTAIGSFAADIVIKNLQKEGYRVIGCDIYQKEWIADAYSVDRFYQVPLAINEQEYVQEIMKICDTEAIQYIMPLTDVEVDLFNCYRKQFEQMNVCVCISDKEVVSIIRDKKKLEEYLRTKTDIRTIPTRYVYEMTTEGLKYPVVCKPYNGRSSLGLKIVNNEKEWNTFLENCDTRSYIVQPYIQGNVVTVDVVRQEALNAIVVIARKELLRTLNGAGTSVYVYYDDELTAVCRNIAQVLNVKGCVNFEFILDEDGIYHFIECNPRFSGGVEFSCMTGYDCVKNHLLCYQNKKIDEFKFGKNMYIARKYEEFITYVE